MNFTSKELKLKDEKQKIEAKRLIEKDEGINSHLKRTKK